MVRLKQKGNKKGQLFQIAWILVVIFVLIISVLLGKVVLNEVNDGLTESGLQTTESQQVFTDYETAYPTFDNMIIVVVVLLTLGLVVTSFLIPSHPIFMVVNILGIFFMVFLAAILANTYAEIAGSTELVSSIAGEGGDFAKMHFVMTKLPWIAAVIVVVSTIAMFAKGE